MEQWKDQDLPSGKTHIVRTAFVALLCLLLTGCVFLPGKFQANLDIRKDGTFSFSYKGELVWAKYEKPPAKCVVSVDDPAVCKCPKSETCDPANEAAQAAGAEARRAGFQRISNFDLFNDEANRAMAQQLTNYVGWKNVEYKGNGVFEVEYRISGKLEQDIVFPALPQTHVTVPFLTIRRMQVTPNTLVEIYAPALFTQQLRKDLELLTGDSSLPFIEHTDGVFLLTTDGEVQEWNGKLKQREGSSTIEWRIDRTVSELPRVQLLLFLEGD